MTTNENPPRLHDCRCCNRLMMDMCFRLLQANVPQQALITPEGTTAAAFQFRSYTPLVHDIPTEAFGLAIHAAIQGFITTTTGIQTPMYVSISRRPPGWEYTTGLTLVIGVLADFPAGVSVSPEVLSHIAVNLPIFGGGEWRWAMRPHDIFPVMWRLQWFEEIVKDPWCPGVWSTLAMMTQGTHSVLDLPSAV
ncbi:uncharacterized protein APUU_31282S [Aspergillus puulaauensis]|uniref:Uncharacterized protein n=1 Tax=Aspergillus puulaauensis TaxID=1220207 RepID=A0A7R7XKU7_9EURO|nr:uncharacterized protein APUU_31282S [Aspergillus puulaauensis]BCS23057.1 hypothetical protein APUU_31282S [Aspergillus puulaauensis]